jgi:conjugative transposon TraN protein
MLCILWGVAEAQVAAGYVLRPVGAQQVPVSGHRVTTLLFPMPIRAGVRVSRDVQVEKVKGVENVVALRATRGYFAPTNLAVFGVDGRVYSFNLEYADTAAAWQYRVEVMGDTARGLILTGLPADETQLIRDARLIAGKRHWMHEAVNIRKMRVVVTGIWSADSLVWLAGQINNRSRLDFDMSRVRLFTEDRKLVKRMAIQEGELEPVWKSSLELVPGETTEPIALGYRSITVPKDKRLVLEVAERDGGRLIRVRIPYKKILEARKLQ